MEVSTYSPEGTGTMYGNFYSIGMATIFMVKIIFALSS